MSDKPSNEETRLRNLKRALGEIDRLASELNIPEDARTTGTSIYRQLRRDGKLPGRSVEEVVAASLYLACRDDKIPRSPDEFVAHIEYDRTTFLRAATYIEEVMKLDIPPASPQIYLDKIGDELALEQETIEEARKLVQIAEQEGTLTGVSPTGGAAGAIYAAGQLTDERLTQASVSDAADVSEVTIRNRYQEILQTYDEATTDRNRSG